MSAADDDGPSTGDILRAVFRLEAERTVCAARLGRVPGAEAMLADVDARLGAAFAALDARGALYPLHMIARRYRLAEEDYLILQLALLQHHRDGDALVAATLDALDDAEPEPDRASAPRAVRLSHALALIAEGFDDWQRAKTELLTLPVFAERLVLVGDGDDPALQVSLSVRELLGLD
ncbi:MAG: hypothetical protein IT385_17240 [Deltaproteobacteria bacterium]|nr:hypothetical protein [Deltaproteobacteria bacterium]